MKKVIALILVCLFSLSTVGFAAEFSDMPDDWSTAALKNAVENGLLSGSDGKIYPSDNMTRAEMATIMVRACGATQDADISAFTDVKLDDWFYSSMSKAVAMGAFNGSDGKLNPNNYITRQEAFVVLARVFSLNLDKNIDLTVLDGFKDNDKISDWARVSVAAIVSNGYVAGANGYINPLNNISRAEFAVVIDRLVKYYIDDPETTKIPSDGNVMIRVGGLNIDTAESNHMVVIGDGVGTADMSISNGNISDKLVVRGGNKILIDGIFKEVRIIMPNIEVEGDPSNIERVYVTKDSTYSMGTILAGQSEKTQENE